MRNRPYLAVFTFTDGKTVAWSKNHGKFGWIVSFDGGKQISTLQLPSIENANYFRSLLDPRFIHPSTKII